jgi:hypothetical protein
LYFTISLLIHFREGIKRHLIFENNLVNRAPGHNPQMQQYLDMGVCVHAKFPFNQPLNSQEQLLLLSSFLTSLLGCGWQQPIKP